LALRPALAGRIDTALVCEELLSAGLGRAQERRDPQQKTRNENRRQTKPHHGEERPEEVRHRVKNYYLGGLPTEPRLVN